MTKYGIDTNVLVRYIVQDHKEQSRKATRFLEKNCTLESPGHISLLVLCELGWVLKRAYGYKKTEIIQVLAMMLSAAEFAIESPALAWEAFHLFEKNNADFSALYNWKT